MAPSHKKPSNQPKPEESKPVLSFDLSSSISNIDKHLEDARLTTIVETPKPQNPEIFLDASHLTDSSPTLSRTKSGLFQSSLLTELAQESEKKQIENLSQTQALKARSQYLNDALDKISGFFISFTQLANDMVPDISRSYRLDARTAYENLKWVSSHVEIRKQNLSATALIAHVTFTVSYRSPEIILVTRPWNQLEILKKEINNLKFVVLDESELDEKRPKQEWIQVRLSSDLPVLLRFQGNYDRGHIDVLSRNLLTLGISSFRIKSEDISSTLLDDIGRILLGRSDKIPDELIPL